MAKDAEAPPPPGLYLVTPRLEEASAFAPAFEAALDAAEVACVLVDVSRNDPRSAQKIVQTLAPLAQARGAAVVIATTDTRLVGRAGADGAHVTASGDALEPAVADAVARLKPDGIVGVAGPRTRHDAMTAGESDIDYIMFGAPSADGWTPPLDDLVERIAWWSEIFTLPCVAFAARLADVSPLAAAGADFVALGEAVWNDSRGPASAVRDAALALREAARRA